VQIGHVSYHHELQLGPWLEALQGLFERKNKNKRLYEDLAQMSKKKCAVDADI